MEKFFRLFIPSWRFFDELGRIERLHYRFGLDASQLGPWVLYGERSPRGLISFFFNPRENLYLSHLRILGEFPQHAELVENLVRYEISKSGVKSATFQFKIGSYVSPERSLRCS